MALAFVAGRGAAHQAPGRGSTLGRAFEIGWKVSGYIAWLILWRLSLARRPSPAVRFARLLESLGTSFVKIGQHLSLRADLFPREYLVALQQLQDNVRSFPAEESVAAIEKAFGKPPSLLFIRFDAEPLAAASVAQVHSARTFDGREVVVKVLRPGVAIQVERDMRILLAVVRFLCHFSPLLTRYKAEEVVKEVRSNLLRELDLRDEAHNVHRFAEAFRDSPTIDVPDIIENLCSETVMVQARSHGARVDRIPNPRRGPELAQNLIDAYIRQFLVLGFFHGDPHPGNLFVTDGGKLCLHDFGIVGALDRPTRHALAAFMLAFAEQDPDWVLDSWLELGMLTTAADRAKLRPVVTAIMADYSRRPLAEWSVGEAFTDLVSATRAQDFEVPLHLLVLARTTLLLEATVRMLDPGFNLLDAFHDRASDVIDIALPPKERETLRLRYEAAIAATEWQRLAAGAFRKFRDEGFTVAVNHEGLPELASQIVRGSNRMSLALVTLGLYLAASLLMQQSWGPRVLDIPVLSAIFYASAAWFTVRLVRAIGRGL